MTENQEVKIIDPANRIKEAYSSPLFLTLSILVSIATAAGLMWGRVNVLYLLTTIGMWLAFAAAKKPVFDSNNKGLTMISGTAKAAKIVIMVAAIVLLVCAVILTACCAVIIPALAEEDAMITIYDLEYYIEQETGGEFAMDEDLTYFLYEVVGDTLFSAAALVTAVLVMLIVLFFFLGVVMLVLSLTFYKTLHKFCRSVCENVKCGAPIEKASSLKTWLLVLGVFAAIGAVGALAYFDIASIAEAGIYIVGYVWVNKYFCEKSYIAAPSAETTEI